MPMIGWLALSWRPPSNESLLTPLIGVVALSWRSPIDEKLLLSPPWSGGPPLIGCDVLGWPSIGCDVLGSPRIGRDVLGSPLIGCGVLGWRPLSNRKLPCPPLPPVFARNASRWLRRSPIVPEQAPPE
jgi:hypothetical protein